MRTLPDVRRRPRTHALRGQVANALLGKGVTLGALDHRSDDAIAVYDELLARFADAPEPALGQLVEMARQLRTDGEGA